MNISLVSLGCDKNLVDSEFLLGLIQEEGFSISAQAEEAQVIIVNTCGFIADAIEESIETILELAAHKRTGVCKALIATGCMAQRYREKILEELPEVDAIVSLADYESIGRIIREVLEGRQAAPQWEKEAAVPAFHGHSRVLSTPSHFAYLKIAEGCDNRCTYCTIPSIRGGYRSRKLEDLVSEGEYLAGQGVKELILVAQDTALYGTDLYGEVRLPLLLDKLSRIPGIVWIRILYCYPEHITEDTIRMIGENPKICKYLDMPIQHCEDEILKRMGRKSTKSELRSIIHTLREKAPEITLRTTLITGFPGESLEHFNAMRDFISEIQFDRLGVFAYSQEEGTPAATLPCQIDEGEKKRRQKNLLGLQKKIMQTKNKEKIGRKLEIIVDGYLPEAGVYCGRSQGDCYEIDTLVYFPCSYELMSGDFVTVRITDCSDYDLKGEIV